jgi:hypothetical protein
MILCCRFARARGRDAIAPSASLDAWPMNPSPLPVTRAPRANERPQNYCPASLALDSTT